MRSCRSSMSRLCVRPTIQPTTCAIISKSRRQIFRLAFSRPSVRTRALTIGEAEFPAWVTHLSRAANVDVRDLNAFLDALRSRHDSFHAVGCRLSDHGLEQCYATPGSERAAAAAFSKALAGQAITADEQTQFSSFMMLFFGRLDAEKGWTKQLHLGARRNVNTSARRTIGPDAGFDTIGDFPQAAVAQRLSQSPDRGKCSAADDFVQPESG